MNIGDIISHHQMCNEEGTSLQRGMNYRIKPNYSIFLMSIRTGAPYADRIEDDGNTLIYEGHDIANYKTLKTSPKIIDQSEFLPNSTTLTENGKFIQCVKNYKDKKSPAEIVKIYEKIKPGIWSFNGFFKLIDFWQEISNNRKVFKFKLELIDFDESEADCSTSLQNNHTRLIPTYVKLEVWKRDNGKCVICGSNKNLHFDHNIPFSKGGSSTTSKNIQILCANCNLSKNDKIV
ncbi:MAG: HNH endonuclease [Endomicrobia bacterium]|nr:HNH endonuclease [Endomicrobiia bacterium]